MRKEFGGMGFRNFYGFNLSMLGKQGWKFMTDQDAIVSRVFKAKYFPNGDFVGARLGHNPSFVWPSIHASQVVVKSGMRWQIGEDKRIRVWTDPWLRDEDNLCVKSPPVAGHENLVVADLVQPNSSEWNMDLLQALFAADDINCITCTPLLLSQATDKMIWKCARNDIYSVKSAYHLLMEKVIDNSELRVRGEWMRIWKLHIPHKIKLLLWRIARRCLPTRDQIASKGVACPTCCPMCSFGIEDEWHCFIGCPLVTKICQAADMWLVIRPIADVEHTMAGFIFSCLSSLSQQQCRWLALILNCIWRRRNDKVWNDEEKPAQLLMQLSMEYLRDWEDIKHRPRQQTSAQQTSRDIRWTKPILGEYKCNIDAAMFVEQGCFGVRMCLRGDNGKFVKAMTRWYSGVPSPQEAEARGLLDAISWLREFGDLKVTIEMNCLPVVDGLVDDHHDDTELGAIIAMCKANLISCNNLKVSFIRRQANFVAHSLARAAKEYASHHIFDIVPTCIAGIIMNEMI